MEYKIVEACHIATLTCLVNVLIGEGWEPQGGVAIVFDSSNNAVYTQALIRRGVAL